MEWKKKLIEPNPVIWMIGVSTLILFGCSLLRHELLQSNAYDLGIFDQAIYLISQGQSPISSFLRFHILGDHAAWIFYLLALFYKIHPSVYWLFAVQAASLALGALPTWHLARHAGLTVQQSIAVAAVYLLYPLVYNINLFDFHPEVIAVPALLGAVLAARLDRIWWFCLCIVLALGCKAVLSLTVAAMGVWLLVFEKKRRYGAIALISGITLVCDCNQNRHSLFWWSSRLSGTSYHSICLFGTLFFRGCSKFTPQTRTCLRTNFFIRKSGIFAAFISTCDLGAFTARDTAFSRCYSHFGDQSSL
jgi:uncharacterized membrane protein